MSKAILILDKMPKSCLECEILDNDELTCIGMKVEYGNLNNRQTWCPLKPLPQKKEAKEIKHFSDFVYVKTEYDLITNDIVGKIKYDVETIFNEGYNSCLDEILGEKS